MPDHHSWTSASEGAVFVFSDGEKDVAFTMILGLAEGTLKSCRVAGWMMKVSGVIEESNSEFLFLVLSL